MKTYIDAHAGHAAPASVLRRLAGFPAYVLAYVKADLDAQRLADVPVQLARKLAGRPSLLRP